MASHRLLASALLAILEPGVAAATPIGPIVTVEPDDFPHGTELNHAVPGVTLFGAGGTQLGGDSTSPDQIFAWTITDPCCPTAVMPSTGIRGFAHAGVNNIVWRPPGRDDDPKEFHAVFDVPTDYVAIDMILESHGDTDVFGELLAYDADGNQVGGFLAEGTIRNEVVEAIISRSVPDIAHIVVSTPDGVLTLDHFRFRLVPEPGSFLLVGVGLLGLGVYAARGRRRAARRRASHPAEAAACRFYLRTNGSWRSVFDS